MPMWNDKSVYFFYHFKKFTASMQKGQTIIMQLAIRNGGAFTQI